MDEHEAQKKCPGWKRMMFLPVFQKRPLLFHREPDRVFRRACSMMMYNAHVGQELDIPPGRAESLAQVGFLGINKILFIE
jgi:hypothetical protein